MCWTFIAGMGWKVARWNREIHYRIGAEKNLVILIFSVAIFLVKKTWSLLEIFHAKPYMSLHYFRTQCSSRCRNMLRALVTTCRCCLFLWCVLDAELYAAVWTKPWWLPASSSASRCQAAWSTRSPTSCSTV